MLLDMKPIFILLLFFSSICFGQTKLDKLLNTWNQRNIPYISVETLAMPKTKAILLDARKKEEFEVSHLKNAIHVGYNSFDLEKIKSKIPNKKDTKIVVYCSVGIRSETIAHKLIKAGYTNVFNLYGGIFEWKNNNFKVVNLKGNTTDSVHTFNKKWSKYLTIGTKVYD